MTTSALSLLPDIYDSDSVEDLEELQPVQTAQAPSKRHLTEARYRELQVEALQAQIDQLRDELGLQDDDEYERVVSQPVRRRASSESDEPRQRKRREPQIKTPVAPRAAKPAPEPRKREYKNGRQRQRPEQTFYNRVKQGRKCLERYRALPDRDEATEKRLEDELSRREAAKAAFDVEWAALEAEWKQRMTKLKVNRLLGDTARDHKNDLIELVASVEKQYPLGKMK